jgi:hypothetical protein
MAKMKTFFMPLMFASSKCVSSCPLKEFLRPDAPTSLMRLGLI